MGGFPWGCVGFLGLCCNPPPDKEGSNCLRGSCSQDCTGTTACAAEGSYSRVPRGCQLTAAHACVGRLLTSELLMRVFSRCSLLSSSACLAAASRAAEADSRKRSLSAARSWRGKAQGQHKVKPASQAGSQQVKGHSRKLSVQPASADKDCKEVLRVSDAAARILVVLLLDDSGPARC